MEIFNLEQEILQAARIVDDIRVLLDWFGDNPDWEGMDPRLYDALYNKFGGLAELYEVRLDKLWDTFEKTTKEYHGYRRAYTDEY